MRKEELLSDDFKVVQTAEELYGFFSQLQKEALKRCSKVN
jgi:hypothetical protein